MLAIKVLAVLAFSSCFFNFISLGWTLLQTSGHNYISWVDRVIPAPGPLHGWVTLSSYEWIVEFYGSADVLLQVVSYKHQATSSTLCSNQTRSLRVQFFKTPRCEEDDDVIVLMSCKPLSVFMCELCDWFMWCSSFPVRGSGEDKLN